MSALVEVVQSDRDAAADLHAGEDGSNHKSGWCVGLRDGRFDDSRSAQAFARHRLASTAPLEGEIVRLRADIAEVLGWALTDGASVSVARLEAMRAHLQQQEGQG